MRLKVGCRLDYHSAYETPLILQVRLHAGLSQSIIRETLLLEPAVPVKEYVDHYGNFCHRLIAPEGKLAVSTEAIVDTEEFLRIDADANFTLIQDLPDDTLIYLLPSRFCESDKLNGKAFEIVNNEMNGYQMVETIRQWVNAHIKYEYNRSTSSTSALDTLRAQHGVCRDMSHLAIALCRSINIPARFVTGYLYNLDPMDLHAWFEAYLDDYWYTFDATQTVMTGGRVTLAYGRDAADVATATYFGDVQLENMHVFVEQVLG